VAQHRVFHELLLAAPPADLPALRHLLFCPLCQRLAEALLFSGALPENLPLPRRRIRRRAQKP